MRLDKFLTVTATATRSESKKAARSGAVTVNGDVVRDTSVQIDEENDRITFRGVTVVYRKFIYIMMNKPMGYISSTDDPRKKTVLELLPENLRRLGLFPCGRLDIDTTGLLILTNNGQLAHRLLSPKYHVDKTYFFTCSSPVSREQADRLEAGVDIGEKAFTKPAKVALSDDGASGFITISEGKFHQVKRMFFAVGSEITSLRRTEFAKIPLDVSLSEGDFRPLTESEEMLLENAPQQR